MKYPLNPLRIAIAIVLTMVVGVLPHHHHHGAPCGVFNECLTHEHTDHCPEDEAHDIPCNENSCYLQAMKIFTQAERPDEIHPLFFDLMSPEVIAVTPLFYYSHHDRTTCESCPLHSGNQQKHYLRGPPVC